MNPFPKSCGGKRWGITKRWGKDEGSCLHYSHQPQPFLQAGNYPFWPDFAVLGVGISFIPSIITALKSWHSRTPSPAWLYSPWSVVLTRYSNHLREIGALLTLLIFILSIRVIQLCHLIPLSSFWRIFQKYPLEVLPIRFWRVILIDPVRSNGSNLPHCNRPIIHHQF